MQAESSLLYPKSESRNSGFRSPEETQQTINFLLAELAKQQERIDKLHAISLHLEILAHEIDERLTLMAKMLGCGSTGQVH